MDRFLPATTDLSPSLKAILSPVQCYKQPEQCDTGAAGSFSGGVAVDEPRAALIGREILSIGGNAVDAATAIYFALSVTLPSSAGLAGGGVCAVHPVEDGEDEILQFFPVSSSAPITNSLRPSAIPGNPRGFFALHAKYGKLAWRQLLVPAENMARFGYRISRAFSSELGRVAPALGADPEAQKIFFRDNGSPFPEGYKIKQVDYSGVLSRLRTRGVGDFYLGPYSKIVIESIRRAGGTINEDDLKNFVPTWVKPLRVNGAFNTQLIFSPPPASAGLIGAQISAMIREKIYKMRDLSGLAGFRGFQEADYQHLLVETVKRVYSQRRKWLQKDGSIAGDPQELLSEDKINSMLSSIDMSRATKIGRLSPMPEAFPETSSAATFAVIDRKGGAVACAVTMNNLFGTGKIAPGLGILLAAAPDNKGRGYSALIPMLVTHKFKHGIFMAAAASGGVTAPTALANIAAKVALEKTPLETAIKAPRVHHSGFPDIVYVEQNMDPVIIKNLRARGHTVSVSTTLGKVNALFCAGGVPPGKNKAPNCSFWSDPRGHGLAVSED